MKTLAALALAGLVAIAATPAHAKDLTITLTDQDQQNMAVLGAVYDQCIAGMVIRNEFTACKNVYGFLSVLTEKAKAAQPAATEAPAPPADKPN